jgi:hypothetical protein
MLKPRLSDLICGFEDESELSSGDTGSVLGLASRSFASGVFFESAQGSQLGTDEVPGGMPESLI